MDIGILLALQEFRIGAGAVMASFLAKMTFLGEMNSVFVVMALLYWAVSKDLGTYLLMGWSGNRLVNGTLKVTVCAYRPWIRDPRIIPDSTAIVTATGYSFPSGHTMNAASIYGGFTVRRDMPFPLRVATGIVVFFVAFSRNYLGVHTPQDVLVGALAGMLVMWLTFKLMRWIAVHPEKDRVVVCAGIALASIVALYAAVKPYPEDFDAAGKLLVDGAKMANDTFKGTGWCAAFLIGWILERRYVRFSTEIPLLRRITRIVIGLLTYYAVSLILVPLIKEWIPGPAGTFVSCFFQMFYVSFIFPFFLKCFEKTEAETSGS